MFHYYSLVGDNAMLGGQTRALPRISHLIFRGKRNYFSNSNLAMNTSTLADDTVRDFMLFVTRDI